jgi:hypothetical protein
LNLLDFLRGDVEQEPFPHLIVENALPEDLYRVLLDARPPWKNIAPKGWKPNHRYDLHASQLTGFWGDFARAICSDWFWGQVKAKFGVEIPGKVGIRGVDKTPIEMDCNVGINTPGLGRVRGPHTDNPREIWAGLWYMGEGGGGDLQLCKAVKELKRLKDEVNDDCVEVVKTVPYRHNTFVCFMAKDAIHSVSERTVEEPRYLANFIAEHAGNHVV